MGEPDLIPAVVRYADREKNRQWAFWVAVVLIFIVGLALRSQTFTEAWTAGHVAWGGAFYSNVARNFLRYGYLGTAFAPVVNTGIVDPSQFEIYFHHPLLVMWLTSVSFHAFDVHEWSARLFPLIFSLLTMGLVFEFARAAFGKGTALCALVFMAVLPVDAYYATHLDPNGSMSIFFTALTVEGYRRWVSSGRDRDYALCAISLVLGCMTAWFTYLVIPGIVAHGWLVHRSAWGRGMRARLLMIPVFALIVLGLFFMHRTIALSGRAPEVYEPLADRFLKRTVNFGTDRGAIMVTHLKHIWTLYTFPFVALTAIWVVFFLRDFWGKRLKVADWCIAILLSYGLLYALAFPGHLPGHKFFARPYAPGVALASAVALFRVASTLNRRVAQLLVIGVVTVVASAVATIQTLSLYRADEYNGRALRRFGEAVAAHTTLRDPVFLPIEGDRVLEYYVDRPMTFHLDTPEKLEAASAAAKRPYLIVLPEKRASDFSQLRAYLRERYPERLEGGLLIYQGAERNTLK